MYVTVDIWIPHPSSSTLEEYYILRVVSLVTYNNGQEKDRIARKGARLPDGDARLQDGYITSHIQI